MILENERKLKRKLKIIEMFTQYKEYNYEPPKMTYDKATGELKIVKNEEKKEKKIIRGFDEVQKEKEKLFREANLDENG